MSEGDVRGSLLDRAHLDAQTGGDRALASELLGLFAGQCRALLPRILDRATDATERADLAHTLKGSALGVGAIRVAGCAAEVEDRLRGGARADRASTELGEAAAATLCALDEPA